MAIDLTEYEAAPRHDGDYGERLAALQARLVRAQIAHAVRRRRAMIVVEGWPGSGRGGIVRRLTAGWDPRHAAIFPIAPPTPDEQARHHMARFWEKLPPLGAIHVFDRGWYGRVLDDRVEGRASKPEWRRGYDEINEFEAQQKDSGTTLVKLFLHLSAETQEARLRERLADPWKRWTLTADDLRAGSRRAEYEAALAELLDKTDTRWAPWKAIAAGHRKFARLAALEYVAAVLEKAVPATEPAGDPAVLELAREMGLLAEA